MVSIIFGANSSRYGLKLLSLLLFLDGTSSNPGASSCTSGITTPKTPTCAQADSGFCRKYILFSRCTPQSFSSTAATTIGGPSSLPRKRRGLINCRRSYTACPHIAGRGGWDCVDTNNDPEMCGGCLSLDGVHGEAEGQDCTAIPNVNIVKCKTGKCIIGKNTPRLARKITINRLL